MVVLFYGFAFYEDIVRVNFEKAINVKNKGDGNYVY